MKRNSVFLLLLGLIILPLYINGLFFGIHAGGDLPFFYPENLKNLIYPWSWVVAPGPQGLGFSNVSTLWLFLPLSIFGIFYNFFGINFYYSFSIVLFIFLLISAFSIFHLAKKLDISYWGRLVSIGVYLANSYILLVIDGGQLIFALGYAFLPLFIFLVINALEKLKLSLIVFSAIALSLLIALDIRIALLGLLFIFIYALFYIQVILEKKLYTFTLITAFILIPVLLHAYWIFPLLNQTNGLLPIINSLGLQDLSFIKIDDALLLHQPQWPNNVFGELQPAAFSFTLLTIIVFSNLLFRQTRSTLFLNFMALISIFLAKGLNPPFEEINKLFSQYIPLFSLFRDPSKFFVLAALCFALLVGFSFDAWSKYLKSFGKYVTVFVLGIITVSFMVPIHEGYFSNLNGLLGKSEDKESYKEIILKQNFRRTLWLNQKPQVAFSDDNHPALDIYALSENPLVTSFNLDNYDRSSFIRNPLGKDILQILGVDVVFLDKLQNIKLSEQERRDNLVSFLNQADWLTSKDKYYELDGSDRFLSVKDTFVVNGDQEIYYFFNRFSNFSLINNGFIFLEQLNTQETSETKELPLITNNDTYGTGFDLLSRNYDSLINIPHKGQWGSMQLSSEQWHKLLQERYILSKNTYPKTSQIYFSTHSNEVIDVPIKNSQTKQIAIEIFMNRRGGNIEFVTNNQRFVLDTMKQNDNFEWVILPLELGNSLKIVNQHGFNAIGKIIQMPTDLTPLFNNHSSKIYILNSKDNKIFRFNEVGNYRALILTNEPTQIILRKDNTVTEIKNVGKTNIWKELGNVNFSNNNEIEVISSNSAQLLFNEIYNKLEIDSVKTVRTIHKEVDRKEIAEKWNSFKSKKIDIYSYSVIQLDIGLDKSIPVQVRAHLFSNGLEVLEKPVDSISDKQAKILIPRGIDEIQFEFLWPQNDSVDELMFKAYYEDTQEVTLLIYPDSLNIEEIFKYSPTPLKWNYVNPTKYEIEVTDAPEFVVFSEKYNPNWSVIGENMKKQSIQTYGLLNGFFVSENGYYTIEYTPQKLVDKFLLVSVVALMLSCLIGLILYIRNK